VLPPGPEGPSRLPHALSDPNCQILRFARLALALRFPFHRNPAVSPARSHFPSTPLSRRTPSLAEPLILTPSPPSRQANPTAAAGDRSAIAGVRQGVSNIAAVAA
jgi:hypothetical protein